MNQEFAPKAPIAPPPTLTFPKFSQTAPPLPAFRIAYPVPDRAENSSKKTPPLDPAKRDCNPTSDRCWEKPSKVRLSLSCLVARERGSLGQKCSKSWGSEVKEGQRGSLKNQRGAAMVHRTPKHKTRPIFGWLGVEGCAHVHRLALCEVVAQVGRTQGA